MRHPIISGVLAIALSLTGLMTPAPARADDDSLRRILGAAVVVGAVALAVRENDRRERQARPNTQPQQPAYHRIDRQGNWHRQQNGWQQPRVDHRPRPQPDLRSDGWLLPASCLRDFRVRGEHVRLFAAHCLERSYRHADRLPLACATTIRSEGRLRTGFDPRCLRHQGYRVTDRH